MALRERTKALILTWAGLCNVELDKLKLDEYAPDNSSAGDPDYLPNTVEVSIIFGGALDEEFVMDELYAVNIVDDVLAVDCYKESQAQGELPDGTYESWDILVHRVSGEFGDYAESEKIYEVRSSNYTHS